uniref:Succinate dehydrogenase assembly factor 4, mitochondrial n=1 Tax=Entomoneis paludosa TaxID=265537 RepID=A0A7S2Y174_9STRA|mmetsp:Transcript_10438/g.21460  ORF Transcript_10438/g.21460 Transcript_10438/m.21460 type:complete len:155 (+) Transcript_10438:145-609(+)
MYRFLLQRSGSLNAKLFSRRYAPFWVGPAFVLNTEQSSRFANRDLSWQDSRTFSSSASMTNVVVEETINSNGTDLSGKNAALKENNTVGEVKAACGDLPNDAEEEEEEQEEMFVDAHESFQNRTKEWGGPRRGGRFPEPTRFGDWERKGRCSDF